MGTMNKMRENTAVILWILVFAFGVIWVLQDSGGLDALGTGSGTDILIVDGDPVSYQEYTQAVDQQVQQYLQQTGESMPPQLLEQQRDRVFEAFIESKLHEHEMDRLGVSVSDDEIYEMVTGDDTHSVIRTYFGDEDGNVDQALLQNFIVNPDTRDDWVQIEAYLRSERRRQKMNHLIAATVRVTDRKVVEEYQRRNQRAEVEWVHLRYADIPNDSVTVGERDLERFYDDNREDYARLRTYTVEYVLLSKLPSARDSAAIDEELQRLKPNFEDAEDDSAFLALNFSERPFTDSWFTADELDGEIATAIFAEPETGRVLGPIIAGDQAHLIKILELQPAEDQSVRASHILIRSPEDDPEIRDRLVDMQNRIQSGEADFRDMAMQHSEDGSASDGGNLGWIGPGNMVEPFENAAFEAPIGQVVGPVKTMFGYHLILVEARAQEEVRIADFALDIRADVGTLNELQEQLEDLRYFAEEMEDFRGEAERMNLDLQQVQIEENQTFIPGIGISPSTHDFLESAKEGAISGVIELDEAFLVAHVETIVPEGYRPFDEVRSELEPQVYVEKKRERLAERLREAYDSVGFDGLAETLGTEVQRTSVTFNTSALPGLGVEPRFVGTTLGLEEGDTSEVIEGVSAVYVLRVTNWIEPAPITETERDRIRQEMLRQRRNQVEQAWLASLREQADVQDLRARLIQQ